LLLATQSVTIPVGFASDPVLTAWAPVYTHRSVAVTLWMEHIPVYLDNEYL